MFWACAKQKTTLNIVECIIDTPANTYIYYTFYVPAGISKARVVGNYEVHGGLIPRIDISCRHNSVLKSYRLLLILLDCNDKSFREIDVYLPTSNRSRQTTYYLSFHNIAPLGESK